MFNFVCKSRAFILHYATRRCAIIPTSTIYSYRCKSTSTTPNEHSFTVSYLVNSCGFPLRSALSASKRIYLDCPEKPDSVKAFFKSQGFSEPQISKLIKNRPLFLRIISPEKTFLPKLKFFYSKGFSRTEVAKFSCAYPDILLASLEKRIIPSSNWLIDVFEGTDLAFGILERNAEVLCRDVETYLVPRFSILKNMGVPLHNIALFFKLWIRHSANFNKWKETLIEIKEMGFDTLKSTFILAVYAKIYNRSNWEGRVKIFRKWGWSEEELLVAFRKYPLCMVTSKEKIVAVMDFLVNEMDIEPSKIHKYPILLGLSKEKRLIPRSAVFQFLLSKGLIDGDRIQLIRMFMLSEKVFLQRFINSFDEDHELSKLYQEKLAVSGSRKYL